MVDRQGSVIYLYYNTNWCTPFFKNTFGKYIYFWHHKIYHWKASESNYDIFAPIEEVIKITGRIKKYIYI